MLLGGDWIMGAITPSKSQPIAKFPAKGNEASQKDVSHGGQAYEGQISASFPPCGFANFYASYLPEGKQLVPL